MSKVYVLTGLGFGDEVKGGTTHLLTEETGAHHIIRTGAAQALHSVTTSDGREHTFSQFGSGTLSGAKTHLSKYMVIEPYALLNEGRALIDLGISDVFNRITIHEDALVVTPFQAIANRLKELSRGLNRYGSVGIGIGETVIDSEKLGDDAVRAKDFGKPWLSDKIEAIRQLKLSELGPILENTKDFSESALLEISMLNDQRIVGWATQEFNFLASLVVETGHLEDILKIPGTVICEGSQGVLLDRYFGFHPYTTKVRTVSDAAKSLLRESGYNGEVVSLGILRGYFTRHGAGPFVTEDAELTKKLPDVHNREHKWQGSFRVGHFDFVAARYAIEACGGQKEFDGLVVTCLDRLLEFPSFDVCETYLLPETENQNNFFDFNGKVISGIKVCPFGCKKECLKYQEELGRLLRKCRPKITKYKKDYGLFLDLIDKGLGVPVVIASFGPTEKDKVKIGEFDL
ncbi:MAG TPA: adenylosuccinate synthetase [Candidatus Paceibacterota bacterium]